jgi:hypothetical protein
MDQTYAQCIYDELYDLCSPDSDDPEFDSQNEFLEPGSFDEVYSHLSREQQTELEIMLSRYELVSEASQADEIKFKFEGYSPIEHPKYSFVVNFTDNLDSLILPFIPTYGFLKRISEYPIEVLNGGFDDDLPDYGANSVFHNISEQDIGDVLFTDDDLNPDLPDNRVVHYWFNHPEDSLVSAHFYMPECYIGDGNISFYCIDAHQAEQDITRFKETFHNQFINSSDSPIMYDIQALLREGFAPIEIKRAHEDPAAGFKKLEDREF